MTQPEFKPNTMPATQHCAKHTAKHTAKHSVKISARPVPSDLFSWDPSILLTAGVDEAGRGPWVGPVVAAAVILDPHCEVIGLNDSKKLKPEVRKRLSLEIKDQALGFAIGEASVQEIDRLNILQATLLAMKRAVEGLILRPEQVLVDGNRLPTLAQPAFALVGGDSFVPCIQAASILAKVHRDEWCEALALEYPGYGFAAHKGYGTAQHQEALARLGVTPWHRVSFAPVARRLAQGQGQKVQQVSENPPRPKSPPEVPA